MFGWIASAYCATPLFPGKQRIFKYLFPIVPFSSAISAYGIRMRRNLADRTYRLCMLGGYGSFISNIIASQKEPFTFVDIGANQGIFSLLAARNPMCRHVVAFEPNPSTFALLVSNILDNGFQNRIVPVCAAIAPEGSDLITFSVPEGHSGGANLFGRGESDVIGLRVSKSALIDLLNRFEAAHLIVKIDVEGAETLVLQALLEAGLLDRISAVIVEVSEVTGTGGHSASLLEFLSDAGWLEEARSGTSHHYDAIYRRS